MKNMLNLTEAGGMDELPEDVMSEIRKNIKAGAKDTEQKWANALELAQKAYEVSAIQRPTPDMKNAWKQYEENIAYAVEMLAKSRGLNGDWRMSSSMFHEALEPRMRFAVRMSTGLQSVTYETDSKSINHLVKDIIKEDPGEYEVKTEVADDGLSAVMRFYKFGVRIKYRVDITQLGAAWAQLP